MSAFAARPNPWPKRALAAVAVVLPVAALAALGGFLLYQDWQARTESDTTVQITEVCAKNLTGLQDADGRYGDWIELTNSSGLPVDLSGWQLSDDPHDPDQYVFPQATVLPAQGRLIVWADGLDYQDSAGALHLNFALNGDGESLYLTSPDGETADVLSFPDQEWNLSFGRRQGHDDELGFFASPTPGAENADSFLEAWDNETLDCSVEFSQAPGSYGSAFALTLTAEDPDTLIFYTTDGSDPQDNGSLYSTAVKIRDRSDDPNEYLTQHCLNDTSPLWVRYGTEQVPKCTVVKARAWQDGRWGPLCVATYWVGTPTHTLPVVSVSADPDELFGSEGIYTSGSTYYTARKYSLDMQLPGNNISGVEIDGTLELFDTDGTRILADTVQLQISGEGSRSQTLQKSLSVELDDSQYTMTIDGVEYELEEFTLRGAGCGATYLSSYQDAFLSNYLEEASTVDLGPQHSDPVILYLEGEYWGIYMIREKKNEDLFERHYGVDGDTVVTLGGSLNPAESAEAAGLDMARLEALDPNNPDNLAWLEANFDLENIVQFVICNLVTNNFDGALVPNHNVILWKTETIDPDNPYADGRWRALINDLDVTFTDPENRAVPEQNRVQNLLEDGNSYGGSYTMAPKLLVHKMLGNEDFRLEFVRAIVEAMQTTYNTDQMVSALTDWRAMLTPEEPLNLARQEAKASGWNWLHQILYGEPFAEFHVEMADWDSIMDGMIEYLTQRNTALTGDLWAYLEPEMTQLQAEGLI